MLWNSAGKSKGTTDKNSGRINSNSGDAQDLSALAKNFKKRFGEEVASDDQDGETMQSSDHVFETPGRKRRFSGGTRPKTPVEEAAESMSPAKLAAEVQKARARAREERFGDSSARGNKLTANPSPSTRPTRSVPMGKDAGTAPRETPPPARTTRIPLDVAAAGQQQQGFHKSKITDFVAASASSPPQEAPAVAGGGGKGPLPAVARPIASMDDTVSASAKPRAVSPLTTTSGAPARISAAPRSNTSPSSAAASSVVVRPNPEEVDTGTPNKTGRRSAAVAKVASIGEAILVDKSPTTTAASGAGPKRPVPDGGDVVVVEPPAKKVLALSKTPSSPSSSPPPPSRRQAAGAAGGKIHTLRLRLRADVVTDPEKPAQMGPPASAGTGASWSSSVEESKGFEPPNPAPDAGVEECKGFDPPNLPPTLTSQHQEKAAPAPSPKVSTEVISAPARASAIASPGAVSRLSVAGDGGTPTSSTFAREGSWGPSFGIVGASQGKAIATPLVPATPAPSPDVSVSKAPNPWILSPETPTFAKNQGRPLAQSFPQPTTPTGVNRNSGANEVKKRRPAGRTAGEGDAIAVLPSVVASSGSGRSGGVRRGVDEPGGDITPVTSKAPTGSSPRRASPPTPDVGGTRGSNVTNRVVPTQARLLSNTSAGSNAQPLPVTQQGAAAGGVAPVAVTAAGRVGAATAAARAPIPTPAPALAAEGEATGVAGEPGAAVGGQVVLGVHMSGRAGQLLERLKREREESLDFERKLTQALLDL